MRSTLEDLLNAVDGYLNALIVLEKSEFNPKKSSLLISKANRATYNTQSKDRR